MGVIEDLFGLDGRVAVVTGGSKGIGMFYSEALADAGGNVVVADVDPASVAETTDRLSESYPDRVLGVTLDVTNRDSVRAMVRQVEERPRAERGDHLTLADLAMGFLEAGGHSSSSSTSMLSRVLIHRLTLGSTSRRDRLARNFLWRAGSFFSSGSRNW